MINFPLCTWQNGAQNYGNNNVFKCSLFPEVTPIYLSTWLQNEQVMLVGEITHSIQQGVKLRGETESESMTMQWLSQRDSNCPSKAVSVGQ